MSGIAGIIHFDQSPAQAGLIESMTGRMAYRGRDGIAHWQEGSTAFGHCQLRTTRESAEEHQPYVDAQFGLVLVLDGRIDNAAELTRELRSSGATLHSRADSELVLRAHELWGPALLDRIEGDFAFSVWDPRERQPGTQPGKESVMYSASSKRLVQLVAGLGSALAPFMVASVIVATPSIGADFPAGVPLLNWVTAAFFIVAAALLIPFGRVADIRGSKKVFTSGMAVYLVAAAVSGLAPGIFFLIAGRAIAGVRAAMVFGTSLALLSLVFPEEERGRAIGINIAAMFAGFAFGLLAGGVIATWACWRLLFMIVAVIATLNIGIILSRVRRECELARETDYDPVGMALLIPGVLLFMYGLATIGKLTGIAVLLIGLAGLAAFFSREHRCSNPLIPRALLGSKNLRRAAGVYDKSSYRCR